MVTSFTMAHLKLTQGPSKHFTFTLTVTAEGSVQSIDLASVGQPTVALLKTNVV